MTEKEFISSWTEKLSDGNLKNFPGDFIESYDSSKIELPGKPLVIGEEFFGSYEVLTVDGNPVMQVESNEKAKYIIYANRLKPGSIIIPNDDGEIKKAVINYSRYLDSIIKEIESDYRKNFPSGVNSVSAVNDIFRILNLTRL